MTTEKRPNHPVQVNKPTPFLFFTGAVRWLGLFPHRIFLPLFLFIYFFQ